MSASEKVQILGIKEMIRGLKGANSEFPKAIRLANKSVAEMIVGPARARMGGHTPRAGSRAAGTIRALASQTRAQIALGRANVPHAIGHEFGSIRYHQFPPWSGRTGYAVYPTIRAMRQQITDTYLDAIAEATQEAFPE